MADRYNSRNGATAGRGPLVNRWFFTINNPGETQVLFDPASMEYLVYQLERGANGTEHYQGYVVFQNRQRLTAVKRLLGHDTAHVEPCKGDAASNKAYCTKEETRISGPWEEGTFKEYEGKKGERSDLLTCCTLIKQGSTLASVAAAQPECFVRYSRGLGELQRALAPPPPLAREIRVAVLWGPTATGKTHRCRYQLSPSPYFVVPGRDPWGGYQGQTNVVFDEFTPDKWSIQDMNRYLDKWECSLDCRYYNKSAAWTRVVICANSHPDSWYLQTMTAGQDLIAAFRRRLHFVYQVLTQEQAVTIFPAESPSVTSQTGDDVITPLDL